MDEATKTTLYLHIGAHRTATTSIQAVLRGNWPRLTDLGYLYPFDVHKHIGMFNAIFGGKMTVARASEKIKERVQTLKKPIHSVVLSDEDVCMRRDLSVLKEFREHFDVKVVFAMRRQDLWLESWWAQNVKGQWDPKMSHISWDDFLAGRERFHWIDYAAYLDHAAQVFGRENIIAYAFESNQMPGGPVETFMRHIGIDDISGWNRPGGENISLTPEMSEFLRHLPLIKARLPVRLQFIEAAERVDRRLREKGAPKLLLTAAQRREIMAGYEDGNRRVAQTYLGRETLFDDPLPPEDAPVAVVTLPSSYKLMARLVVPFMTEVINIFGFDKPEEPAKPAAPPAPPAPVAPPVVAPTPPAPAQSLLQRVRGRIGRLVR